MFYRISQLLLEIVIRVCFNVDIYGRGNIPNKGPYLIISNHSSIIDSPLIGMVFRKEVVSFLAKKNI